MRVALVHERFTELGGSERVVAELHRVWPTAPIYTTVVDHTSLPPGLTDADIRPSSLQRLYRGGPRYAHLLPLLPAAIARIAVGDVDLVVTSHHAFANRVRPSPGIPVVSYTHTPARWMWDPSKLADERGGRIGRAALAGFARSQRQADRAAAARLRGVVVNSAHVADRVDRWWSRASTIVPPPVDVERFTPGPEPDRRDDFFLLVGRLVPYKRPLVAVEAAARAGVRLVVAGEGRLRGDVEALAGPETEVLGAVDDVTLLDLYRRCRALVFPGEEDFGIVPVEAQACGAPVVARGVGGALDSVVDGVTGVLYGRDTDDEVEALAQAMRSFEPSAFDPRRLRDHAESFSPARFRERWIAALARILNRPADELR